MTRRAAGAASSRWACLSSAAFWLLSADGAEGLERVADPEVDVEAEALASCEAGRVRRLVSVLPAKQRTVIQLRYGFAGRPLSCRETASYLNVSVGTVAARERQALDRLRQFYVDELPGRDSASPL